MTGISKKLAALVELAALKQAASLAALARSGAERDTLRLRMETLDAAVALAAKTAKGDRNGGSLAAQEKFSRLMQQQRAGLNLELARCTAQWLENHADATRSFGQCEVLAKMAKAAADMRRIKRYNAADCPTGDSLQPPTGGGATRCARRP